MKILTQRAKGGLTGLRPFTIAVGRRRGADTVDAWEPIRAHAARFPTYHAPSNGLLIDRANRSNPEVARLGGTL